MTFDWLFKQFIQKSPVTVMVRATLENAFSPETINRIFSDNAKRQYEGELLFSSVVDLMTMVVWRQKKSVREAYQDAKDRFEVSLRSVYNKVNRTETQVCRSLVHDSAERFCKTVDFLSTRKPLLKGYHTWIVDGNHLTSTEHRLEATRRTNSGPLPGQTLAVLDADRMLFVDLFCCEDGEAQERRMFSDLIPTTGPGQLWISDRNFCTTGFVFGLARRGACFLIRRHKSTLVWEKQTRLKKIGRCATGMVYSQTISLQQGDDVLDVRMITIKLDKPLESGDTEIELLTNLPKRDAGDVRAAMLYLNRWTIENAFQELEQSLRSEINTLGYPRAALLGFAVAVITYNALSIAKWAIEAEHKAEMRREELSGYYMASSVAADYGGMLIVLPPERWTARFADLTPKELARELRVCAKNVRPDRHRKNVRGPKKRHPPRTSGNKNHHVSTAVLLEQLK